MAYVCLSKQEMDEFVEGFAKKIAIANNGGDWSTHYTEEQKNVWRQRGQELFDEISNFLEAHTIE